MKRVLLFGLAIALLIRGIWIPTLAQSEYGHVYCKNSANVRRIALSFDDGPHPRYTERILKILEEYGVTATFFVIGVNALTYSEDLQKIVDSGCEIGNHTYSHGKMGEKDEGEIEREILLCEELLTSVTGKRPTLFRPPEGCLTEDVKRAAKNLRYDVILWSVDTLDWAMNPVANIEKIICEQVRGGDIILMHDYVSGGNITCEALRRMIPRLQQAGYEFVTVSELIRGSS